MFSYIINGGGLTAVVDGRPVTVSKSHPSYNSILECIKEKRFDDIFDFLSISKSIKKWVSMFADVEVDEDLTEIRYNGKVLEGDLPKRMLEIFGAGLSVEPMVLFLKNLEDNPSEKAVKELYSFLEFGNLPITEDGHFIAYKRVNGNYTSVHDGKTDNSIGKIVSMPREEVDADSNITCSYGLHICSFNYLRYFAGEKVILLKVNPADVVSIPKDYNDTKARVCRYEVIGELQPHEYEHIRHEFDSPIYITNSSQQESLPEEEFEDEDEIELLNDEVIVSGNVPVLPVLSDKVEVEQYSDYYIFGYILGYNDGKNKVLKKLLDIPHYRDHQDVGIGYEVGFRHGKNKKKKLFKEYDYPELMDGFFSILLSQTT